MKEHAKAGYGAIRQAAPHHAWRGQPHIILQGHPDDMRRGIATGPVDARLPESPGTDHISHEAQDRHLPESELGQPLNATCIACMVLLMLIGVAVGALHMI